jgi:hypothetical protein
VQALPRAQTGRPRETGDGLRAASARRSDQPPAFAAPARTSCCWALNNSSRPIR